MSSQAKAVAEGIVESLRGELAVMPEALRKVLAPRLVSASEALAVAYARRLEGAGDPELEAAARARLANLENLGATITAAKVRSALPSVVGAIARGLLLAL